MDRRAAIAGVPTGTRCIDPPRAAGQVALAPVLDERGRPMVDDQGNPVYAPPPQPIIAESLLALQGIASATQLTTQIERGTTSVAATVALAAVAVVLGLIAARSGKT